LSLDKSSEGKRETTRPNVKPKKKRRALKEGYLGEKGLGEEDDYRERRPAAD